MPRKFKEIMIGDVVGDLIVVNGFRDISNNRRMLKCRCNVCGRERDVYEGNLRKNPESYTHGNICGFGLKKIDPKFYDVWAHMKDRIYNPKNKNYVRYGGRGLTTDYDAFVDFWDDEYGKYLMAKSLNPDKKISLDRMNNNLGYVKGNLSWTTPERQTRNSSRVYLFLAISPTGQVYLTNNQTMFGANHNLESKHISDCLRGLQQTTAGGWRFSKIDLLFAYQFENDPTVIRELYY